MATRWPSGARSPRRRDVRGRPPRRPCGRPSGARRRARPPCAPDRGAPSVAGSPDRSACRSRTPAPARPPSRRTTTSLSSRPFTGVGLGHADLTSREERLQWCTSATSCSRSPSWPSWSGACSCSRFATSRAEAGTVAFLLDPEFWARCLGIVVIDLTLAGADARILARAVGRWRTRQQFWARIGGTAGAVALRLLGIVVATLVLRIPLLQLGGGLLLLWIAVRLVRHADPGHADGPRAGTSLWEAIWIIVLADAVMSLDNVL